MMVLSCQVQGNKCMNSPPFVVDKNTSTFNIDVRAETYTLEKPLEGVDLYFLSADSSRSGKCKVCIVVSNLGELYLTAAH